MIYSLLEAEVRNAVSIDENLNEDGTVNWNFVDADCYMSGIRKYYKDDTTYYEDWNDICDTIEREIAMVIFRKENQLEFDFS